MPCAQCSVLRVLILQQWEASLFHFSITIKPEKRENITSTKWLIYHLVLMMNVLHSFYVRKFHSDKQYIHIHILIFYESFFEGVYLKILHKLTRYKKVVRQLHDLETGIPACYTGFRSWVRSPNILKI